MGSSRQTASAIQTADLPAGSTNYIQNQNALTQTGNFNISDNGVVGGNFGVGTTTPVDKMQIVKGMTDIRFGPPSEADGMEIRSNMGGHSPAIYLTHTGTGGRSFRIIVVLLNAVKEQQQQIESLKNLACRRQPKTDFCKAVRRSALANRTQP